MLQKEFIVGCLDFRILFSHGNNIKKFSWNPKPTHNIAKTKLIAAPNPKSTWYPGVSVQDSSKLWASWEMSRIWRWRWVEALLFPLLSWEKGKEMDYRGGVLGAYVMTPQRLSSQEKTGRSKLQTCCLSVWDSHVINCPGRFPEVLCNLRYSCPPLSEGSVSPDSINHQLKILRK